MAVPLIAWWPLTFVVVATKRPRPGEPGVDMTGLLYIPAAVSWLPMVAVTALVAWLVGRRLDRKRVADRSERKRRNRGLVCGIATLVIVPLLLLMLEQAG